MNSDSTNSDSTNDQPRSASQDSDAPSVQTQDATTQVAAEQGSAEQGSAGQGSAGQGSAGQGSADSPASTGPPVSPSATESPEKKRSKILIGSQRDPANPDLSPTKPKTVRHAEQSGLAEVPTQQPPTHESPTQESPPEQAASGAPSELPPSELPSSNSGSSAAGPSVAVASSANGLASGQSSARQEHSEPVSTSSSQSPTETSSADDPTSADDPASADNTLQPAAVESTGRIADLPNDEDDIESELEAALESIGEIGLDQIVSGESSGGAAEELAEDSRHKATVVKIHKDDVFFSLGGRHQGVVSLRQFKKPPKSGSMMDVVVKRFNAEDGLYELMIPGASVDVADWSDLSEGAVVEARITGSNTGGLECMVNTLRGFIPASHISLHHVDNLSEFINQKMQCVVVEVNPRRRKLVLSHRAILEREREEQRKVLLEKLEPGAICDGVVRSVRDFGAFVDIGGIEGLLHISKISWDHIEHPKEVLQEGQQIRVKIEKINAQTGKIALTYRDLLEHPWDNVEQKYHVDGIVTGSVSRIAKFGAFVKLEPGVEGMIHISELAHHHVASVSSIVNEGQTVQAKVLSVDRPSQRIALSLKATQPEPEPDSKAPSKSDKHEPIRESAVPQRKGPLKGGTDRKSGGEQFGLNW